MRLILCVKRDLHGCIFLNRLLPRLAGHQLCILLSAKTRPAEESIPALAELAFLERTLPLQVLFPLLDAGSAADGAQWATFAGLARRFGVAAEVVADVNTPALLARMTAFAPDLIVSARFSHIFKPQTLALARHGVVNLHPGALPTHAGLFAPMRAVAEGAADLTCTLHFMDAGIDSGPIIAVERIPYRPAQGLLQQIADIYPLAIEPLLTLVGRLERGETISAQPQDAARRRYRSLPDAAEIAAFLAAGHRFWDPQGYQALLAGFLPSAG